MEWSCLSLFFCFVFTTKGKSCVSTGLDKDAWGCLSTLLRFTQVSLGVWCRQMDRGRLLIVIIAMVVLIYFYTFNMFILRLPDTTSFFDPLPVGVLLVTLVSCRVELTRWRISRWTTHALWFFFLKIASMCDSVGMMYCRPPLGESENCVSSLLWSIWIDYLSVPVCIKALIHTLRISCCLQDLQLSTSIQLYCVKV